MALLRQGAGPGRKVLWVWDKAGVDFAFWQERKASGIYFLSLRKEGLCLEVEKERVMDVTQPIHQGVTADRVLTDRRGIRVREITFGHPCDGVAYIYLTTEMTLEPGLLALLYKTRWEIEKVFDETKTKLAEKKSWATTTTRRGRRTLWPSCITCCCSCRTGTSNKAWKTPPNSSAAKNGWSGRKRNSRKPGGRCR